MLTPPHAGESDYHNQSCKKTKQSRVVSLQDRNKTKITVSNKVHGYGNSLIIATTSALRLNQRLLDLVRDWLSENETRTEWAALLIDCSHAK